MNFIDPITSIWDLSDDDRKIFLANVRDIKKKDIYGKEVSSARRKAAQARIDIAKNDFSDLVDERIVEVWDTKAFQDEIKVMAKMSLINPLINITRSVTTAYNIPPYRFLRDENEETNKKFSALLEDGNIAIAAKEWLELSFITNVIIVVPAIRQEALGPKLFWDIHLANNTEVIPHANNPIQPAIMGTTYGDLVCVLDADAWWYFDKSDDLVGAVEHGLQEFPGTAIRLNPAMGGFWDETRGNNVVFGTIELARLYSELNWVRKTQSKKIPVVISENLIEDVPVGQSFHPEQPFEAQTKDPQNFKFEIKDFVTSVAEFNAHMRLIYSELCESFGIYSTMVDLDSSVQGAENTTGLGQALQHSKLAEIREDHIQWLRLAEKDLMKKTAAMATKFDHPLAVDPATVQENYEVVWGPLSFVDHPQVKITYMIDRIKVGAASAVDIVRDDHPNWSREQCLEYIEMIIEEKRVIAEFHAKHNLPADPVEANMTVAERQGKIGGQAKNLDENEDNTEEE